MVQQQTLWPEVTLPCSGIHSDIGTHFALSLVCGTGTHPLPTLIGWMDGWICQWRNEGKSGEAPGPLHMCSALWRLQWTRHGHFLRARQLGMRFVNGKLWSMAPEINLVAPQSTFKWKNETLEDYQGRSSRCSSFCRPKSFKKDFGSILEVQSCVSFCCTASESAIRVHILPPFWISQCIKSSSLCYTVCSH